MARGYLGYQDLFLFILLGITPSFPINLGRMGSLRFGTRYSLGPTDSLAIARDPLHIADAIIR